MKAPFFAIALVVVGLLAGSSAIAQTPSTPTTPAQAGGDPGITPNGAIGEVKVIDNAEATALYERRLVLVRPDGHVAWRGDTAPADPLAVIDTVRGAGPRIAARRANAAL